MISCSRCRKPLPNDVFNTEYYRFCPHCRIEMRGEIYPAMFRPKSEDSPKEAPVIDEEAGCFYHPKKKAVAHCSTCGRFVCALCDIDMGEEHICPACLESGKRQHKIKKIENRRTLYDNIALSLAIIPVIFVWLTIITAPIVIFLVIKHWNAPTSIIPRTKIRFIVAFLLAALQIVGWLTALFLALFG